MSSNSENDAMMIDVVYSFKKESKISPVFDKHEKSADIAYFQYIPSYE